MPVVDLEVKKLQKLLGRVSRKTLLETLPYLGLDIESEDKHTIRVEYSPNRPDYATDYGIALGLEGLLGLKTGIEKLKISKGKNSISVSKSVSTVRPFVTGIMAKNGHITDSLIRQLMEMQEDLHFGIGRRRKKSSIGIHDSDKISFPLKYSATTRQHRFTPLHSDVEMSAQQIIDETDIGKNYGAILGNAESIPVITDSENNTVSFPPIINASNTTVTTKTKNLFVEITGTDKNSVEDMLSVVAQTLQRAGFDLVTINIYGANNSTPDFSPRKQKLSPNLVNQILGLSLSNSKIISYLKKCRLDAKIEKNKIICSIPRYRFDIFGEMDLVEEVALGYGIQNLTPTLPISQTLGKVEDSQKQLKSLSQLLIGLGFTETLNSSLTSSRILFEQTNRNNPTFISVIDSKSQEHTILRDMILPELLNNLSTNIHESYPQKLFETGTIFLKGNPISEDIHLCCISAHKQSNFSELKSVLQSILRLDSCLECITKKPSSENPLFANGRHAEIFVNEKNVGIIGEVNQKVIENFKIRVPVCGFELKLSGLIFD